MTKQERLEYQRKKRELTTNASTKKYEKSHKGFIMRLYRNMLSRISGVQKQKFHLYGGKALLPKEQFYNWALNSHEFFELFSKYKDSGFDRKLCPSVDRIDSNRGYELNNMEWVTHSENSRRGSISKKKIKVKNEATVVGY